jgi:chromosome segregation protein
LYLKRLEIVGFKSFADAFELEFQRGISCIVGPNGCGKSNIADAIRWSLGSQSPTELRADRMEDVIFSGTVERKPQGMAEVILTFDNSNRELDLDFDEVTVTRRLFRSGDSEYLLNGNRCRLMDITDLIVDKGLGSNGYWILEKNMTQLIIESGPSDRRFLFDEAAGIVKYKMQRHRAELKLNAVADDLERLDDIISEVDRNVGQLKKQVSAYQRWERAEKRIREIRGLLDHRVLQESQERKHRLEEMLKQAGAREQKASAAVKAASGRQASARVSLEKAQTRLDGEHSRVSELDGEISRASRELAVAEERIRNSSSRIESAGRESAGELEKAERLSRDGEQLRTGDESLEKKLEEARSALEKASSDSAVAEKCYADTASQLEEARKEYERVTSTELELQKEYTDSLRSRERAEQELKHLGDRKSELETQIMELEETVSSSRSKITDLRERRSGLEEGLSGALESMSVITSELGGVRSSIRSLEMEAGVLESRIRGLMEADGSAPESGVALSSRLVVRDGLGMAVGAWLDSFQDAAYCRKPEELPEGGTGERFFLTVREPVRPAIPEGSTWLPDCLEEGSDPAFRGMMARAVLAPDRRTALEWFLGGSELDIVTASGDLFRSDGLVRLGVPESGGGAIERRALAEKALRKAEELSSELDGLRKAEEELSGREREAASGIEEIRRLIASADREEASLEAATSAREERLAGLLGEAGSIEERLPELREAALQQDSDDITGRMGSVREELEGLSSKLKKLEELRDSLGAELNSLLRSENSARLEFSSLETSLGQNRRERERLLDSSREARERSGQIEKELEELREEKSGLEELIAGLRVDFTRLSGLREDAEKSRTDASRERAEWLEKTRVADEELMQHREELSAAREERVTVSGELQMVTEKCLELDSRELSLPDEGSRFWEFSSEKLVSELDRQTGFRENLGPINMLAVTEYEEGMKRVEFLTEQRTDLDEARSSLLGAITEINRTAARRFDETFVEVRSHFKDMFTSLFGGGEADIIALDSEDPLEGGVQIVARPPGKKMENITALSSGERAMTAAALLFALYLVKPSPFCVLDELDAPLDDTNVDNYVNLLKSFVHRTQFIVITHNKRTMEAADRLFGITMAEKGVSIMTTVSLEKARRMSEEEE